MSMDPSRWVNTIPFIGAKSNQEKYKLDYNKWVNTLPSKDDNTLILSNTINSNPKSSSGKKYSLIIIVFIVGLILVSAIKNGTRNLQKGINNLKASIIMLKFNLDQATLDHEVITSPENISLLAKKYLESDLIVYKKSQIKNLNQKTESISKLKEVNTKDKGLTDEIKLKVAKRIEKKRTELKKLKEIYSEPEKIPEELKGQVAKKIKKTKTGIKNLYTNPQDAINIMKAQKWAAVQVVKVFFGIPIIPGR